MDVDLALVLSSLIAGLALVLVFQNFRLHSYWAVRGIKGPFPLPFLGSYGYYMFTKKIMKDMEWFKQYGRVYGLYQGYKPTLRITDRELVTEILVKKFNSFTDRDSSLIYGDNPRKWTFWAEGKHWNTQRALLSPLFASSKIKRIHQVTDECAQRFTKFLANKMMALQPSEGAQAGALKSVNVSKDEFMAYALDVIGCGLFGIKLDTYQDKGSEFFRRAYAFSKFDALRFVVWSATPKFLCRRFKLDVVPASQWEYFDKLSQTIINERRKIADGQKTHQDLIQYLIDAKLPEDHDLNTNI